MAALGVSLARCWAHLELKNPNRSYFYRRDESVFRSSHVPWSGARPSFFKQLRGVLISRDVAASDVSLPVDAAAVCLLELLSS